MNTIFDKPVADFEYIEYQLRQRYAVGFENIHQQSQLLRSSDQFIFNGEKWVINPYNGFAVVSMVSNNPSNTELSKALRNISSFLNQELNERETYLMLPEGSYHQTIANTLSGERFFDNIVNKGKLEAFPHTVQNAFCKIQFEERNKPIKMNIVGLNVFGTCIALLGEFFVEDDFKSVISFREQFYNDPEISSLGVKWTRPFVGHITLAYLGREIGIEERLLLADTINKINSDFDFSKVNFNIAKTELRSYPNLSCFEFKSEYPEHHFINTIS